LFEYLVSTNIVSLTGQLKVELHEKVILAQFLRDKFFGTVLLGVGGNTGAGFDGGGDVVAEGSDDAKNGFGIVGDGLISENFSLLVHDADLNDVGVVVNTDENW
jgi:hypothetical protein